MDAAQLSEMIADARSRTLELVADLTDEEMLGPKLRIVNPPLWEIGHVAWFQDYWVLRHAAGQEPHLPQEDALYDSMAVAHDTRWDRLLPSRAETIRYTEEVRDRALHSLRDGVPSDSEVYFHLLSVFHEDMHDEAFTYTRQTHAYPPPPLTLPESGLQAHDAGPLPGDVCLEGGVFMLGAATDESFVFDNEKWAHPVDVAPFRIAKAAVTQEEFARFVDAGGYSIRVYWDEEGWQWRVGAQAEHPVYWRKRAGGWERRVFDHWVPLEPHKPVLHVNWHEASAYCRWAGRRLPTESEWEMAASWDPAEKRKRRYPWGDDPPTQDRANLDWTNLHGSGTQDVGSLPAGDSPAGCRQMIGNVWEWTSTDFAPYPGFVVDPYKDYSEPWFHTHKVLRGGCWATRSRLIRNTWRNFYKPDRRDVWAGFRTCAL